MSKLSGWQALPVQAAAGAATCRAGRRQSCSEGTAILKRAVKWEAVRGFLGVLAGPAPPQTRPGTVIGEASFEG